MRKYYVHCTPVNTTCWSYPDGSNSVPTLVDRRKLLHIANQAKLHSFCTTPIYMFRVLVPRNHDQAMDLDAKNGNNLWLEAEKVEAFAVLGYGTFNDKGKGGPVPSGYKKITIRFVYAVKHDG